MGTTLDDMIDVGDDETGRGGLMSTHTSSSLRACCQPSVISRRCRRHYQPQVKGRKERKTMGGR